VKKLYLMLLTCLLAGALALTPTASAQVTVLGATGIQNVAVLPVKCSPTAGTRVVFLTVGDIGIYYCSSANNWTKAGVVSGSGITSLNGLTADPQVFAVGTAGTDIAINSSSGTHTFNIPTASAANRGVLSSTLFSDFNARVKGGASLTTAGRLVKVSAAGTIVEDATLTTTGGVITATGFSGVTDVFTNATSGQITVQTVAGALGTRVISLPAETGTVLTTSSLAASFPTLNQNTTGNAATATNGITAAAVVGDGVLVVGSGGARGVVASTLDATVVKSTKGVPSAATAGTDYVAPGTATTFTANQTFQGDIIASGGTADVNFSAAATSKPFKQGLATNIPATCAVGETYFETDAPAGSNLFACTSTNTWNLTAGAGDVVGPVSATSGHFATYNGTTGKLLADTLALVTSVGSPGSNTNVPSEAAVRAAVSAAGGGNVNAGGTLTADLPVIGVGTTAVAVGTRSGNTTYYVTTSGTQTASAAVVIDANGNHVAATSPIGGIYGGTGNAFFQLTGPDSTVKTYTFPNASSTVAVLGTAQSWTAAQTFTTNTALFAGSSSGTTTVNAAAAASGTLTLPAGTGTVLSTIAAVTAAQGGTGANNTATSTYYLKGNGTNFITSNGAASGTGACTNQAVTTLNSDAAPTCTTITSSYVNTSIAQTGVDINTSHQVTALHLGTPTVSGFGLTANTGGIFYSGAANMTLLSGTATANQLLMSGAAAAPAWSTAVYPATTTVSQLLYSSSANTVAGLATGNNGVLITSGSGVPSISSTLPSAVQGNITSTGTIGSGTWNGGVVGLVYGGSNANLTASNGGIIYTSATAMAVMSGTANASRPLLSGASTTPTWAVFSLPGSVTSGGISYFSSTSAMGSSGLLTQYGVVLGGGAGGSPTSTTAGATGSVLAGNTSAAPTFQTVSTVLDTVSSTQGTVLYRGASSWSALATGTSGQFLQTQGAAANPQWASVSGVISGLTTNALVNAASSTSVATPSATTTLDSSGNISTPGSVTTGAGSSTAGAVSFTQGTAPVSYPANSFSIVSPASIATAYQWTVPGADAAGAILSNGSGTLSILGTNGSGNLLRSAGTAAIATGKTLTANASVTLAGTDSSTLSLAGNLTTSGAYNTTLTTTGTTSLTLPTSGTLATNPMTGTGDMVYGGTSGVPTRLAASSTDYLPFLSRNSAAPQWATIAYPTSATSGGIPYFSSSAAISSSGALGAAALVVGGGAGATPSTPSATTTLDASGNLAVAAAGSIGSADTGAPKLTFAANKMTANQPVYLGVASNQLVTGTSTNLTTVSFPASSGAVTVTMPNVTSTVATLGSPVFTTNITIPNAASPTIDALGKMAIDNNLWGTDRGAIEVHDGTAATALVGVLVSDTPTNGQVPTWNTGGTITWESPAGSGTVTVSGGGNLTSTALMTGAGTQVSQTPSATSTLDASGNLAVAAGGSVGSADTGAPKLTFATNKMTANQPLNLGVASNQLVTGTSSNLTTVNFPASSGAVTVTMPSTTSTVATVAGTLPIGGGTLTGNLLFTDNTLDIGATGATRPRTAYLGTSLVVQATTNQIVTGTSTNLTTLHFPASSGAVTVTMPSTTSTVATTNGNVATATNIANNTGTTTTVLHGNASGAPAFGAVVSADITDGTIVAADVADILKTRSFTLVIQGTGTAGVLLDTDDQPAVWYNSLGQGVTLTGVSCKTDSATATRIQLNRDDGSPAAILTNNTAAGVDCSSTRAAGTLDGTEEHIASTNAIDFVLVDAGDAGKWVSITVTYTLD
jgi:hypothetical protein